MTAARALLWKEWRELRWFLIVGIGVFLFLPFVGAIQGAIMYGHERLELMTSPWVIGLGGVLAVFIAVGATCRDLSERLINFWQSRPISIGRWTATKYLCGLALVLFLCTVPLVLEIAFDRPYHGVAGHTPTFLVWHTFAVAAIYSVAFLMGCLVRRVAQAAMLSLAAMLLIYFLPYVVPPLNWLSLPLMLEASSLSGAADIPLLPWRVGYTPQHILYVLGMLAICALSALGAWQAVRRGWRIEADRKLMYWSIGLAALLLVWSAAYQVGSNLPVEQEVVLPGLSGDPSGQHREVLAIAISGDRGAVLTCRWPGVTRDAELWPFEMTSEGVGLRERIPIELPENDTLRYGRPWFSISDDGRYAYLIGQRHTMDENGRPMVSHPFLYTVAMQGGDGSVAHQLPLSSEPRGDWVRAAHRMGDRMYVATSGGNLLSIDLTDAAEPMLVWQRPWLREGAWAPSPEAWQAVGFRPGAFASPWVWPLRARLLELEGFTPRQRLEATVVLSGLTYCGDILAFMSRDGVAIARLRSLTNTEAVFEFAGEYRRTAIQHMLEDSPVIIAAEGNHLYARTQSGFGAHAVSVFDVADPQRPLRVGHFAMPSAYWFEPRVAPLPDGRAVVVGGDRLFVTGRPRVRSRN